MHVGTMRTGEAGPYVILSSPTNDVFPLSEYRHERLLDSIEAAAVLGIHPKTLQRMARSGQIRGIRVGKLWRFRRSEIDMWIETKLASWGRPGTAGEASPSFPQDCWMILQASIHRVAPNGILAALVLEVDTIPKPDGLGECW